MAILTFRELTSETWPDFERLFRGLGGNDHCWCMAYRFGQSAAKEMAAYGVKKGGFQEHSRVRMETLVQEGLAVAPDRKATSRSGSAPPTNPVSPVARGV